MSDWAPIRDQIKERVRLSEIVGRKVQFDRRRSTPGRGEFWACCPFHSEKSPSFHVLDREGYYKCFGCGAGGDVVNFVMETENRSYREAMEMLAEEAGVELPKPTREEHEKAQMRASLHDVLERAAKFFEDSLRLSVGQAARDYLRRRTLPNESWAEFRLGYWPGDGRALIDHLKSSGVTIEQMRAAGLLSKNEEPFDLMRGRLIFPITDGRGRVIAFGGRALREDQQPKYLNSPDTELFHKGRTLYNFAKARGRVTSASPLRGGRSAEGGSGGGLADSPPASARADHPPTPNAARSDLPARGRLAAERHSPLIVAEGYMDVIALSRAGFTRSVAPLGTALTEDQLELIWSVEDAPIICFDGDAAGTTAASRALDRALPLLKSGRTLKFAFLPPGQDPDDLIKTESPAAMARILEAARPLAQTYWDFTVDRADLTTPDGRASAETALLDGIKRIADAQVRRHYEAFVRGEIAKWFQRQPVRRAAPYAGTRASGGKFPEPKPRPTAELRARRGRTAQQSRMAEEIFVLSLLTHPEAVNDLVEEVGGAALTNPPLVTLRDEVVRLAARGIVASEDLIAALDGKGLAGEARRLMSRQGLRCLPSAHPASTPEAVTAGLKDLIATLAGRQEAVEASGAAKLAVEEGLAKESWAKAGPLLKATQRQSGGS